MVGTCPPEGHRISSVHKEIASGGEICEHSGRTAGFPTRIDAFALPFPATSRSGRLLA
jgi:hypothetical protein